MKKKIVLALVVVAVLGGGAAYFFIPQHPVKQERKRHMVNNPRHISIIRLFAEPETWENLGVMVNGCLDAGNNDIGQLYLSREDYECFGRNRIEVDFTNFDKLKLAEYCGSDVLVKGVVKIRTTNFHGREVRICRLQAFELMLVRPGEKRVYDPKVYCSKRLRRNRINKPVIQEE